LHQFSVERKKHSLTKQLSLNGVASLGHQTCYVEDVAIDDFSVEGYDVDDNPSTVIYIRSKLASTDNDFDVWYELKKPASAYHRYHEGFTWVSEFGKHVIDFMTSRPESSVHLGHFKRKFRRWLVSRWSAYPRFNAWFRAYGKKDFRVALHAYVDYLYGQAGNLSNARTLLSQPLWAQCLKGGCAIKEHPLLVDHTIATPIVYECFKGMYFGQKLRMMSAHPTVKEKQDRRKQLLGFPKDLSPTQPVQLQQAGKNPMQDRSLAFELSDVISVEPDNAGTWKTKDQEWLAYVQRVEPLNGGVQRLFVLWLYRPADTTISTTVYPVENELFLSDNCNCSEKELLSTDVVRKLSVDWRPKNLDTVKDVLIRQKYVTHDSAFVTLKDSDLKCSCSQPKVALSTKYGVGDSVYITATRKGRERLEPVVIVHWGTGTTKVQVRRLVRLQEVCTDVVSSAHRVARIQPNELVWTDEVISVAASRIQDRKCHIRFYPLEDVIANRVATPYDRGGNGDFFYFAYSMVSATDGQHPCLEKLSSPPASINQGFDPCTNPVKALRGLSIFSGGGNLDRGIEEGGAVKFVGAVDLSEAAVHMQHANARHPKDLQIFHGSVDDNLSAVLQGRTDIHAVFRIGDIQFIAAGSPCPGFSSMQQNWKSDQSLRNASHVTTFCSYVDVFRPERALLENVVTMANTRTGHEEEKVFSQLIACLVAMGYQVSQFIMDSWSYGSSQRRTRLFVSITAPGLTPTAQPFLTHSHPDYITGRSLGRLSNGEAFGCREKYPTPFGYVNARDATLDLPDIGTSHSQICVPFPDHRVTDTMNHNDRAIIRRIPISPPKQGYIEALKLGLLPASIIKTKKKNPGKCFQRVRAAGQFPTITTGISPQDNRCGNVLHWEQPRPMTIMEARRAQGFPDHEVIIGSLAEQWRIIGNAVDRNVALALGIALQRAMDAMEADSNALPPVQKKQATRGGSKDGLATSPVDAKTTHKDSAPSKPHPQSSAGDVRAPDQPRREMSLWDRPSDDERVRTAWTSSWQSPLAKSLKVPSAHI
jgi:DNA (cytosine-5)-methyltransferase 1